jgi:hypothetical protein
VTPFKPMCVATALPTMPHRDPDEACRVMLENFPEAPCIPRLSRSIRMYMDGMPCLVIDRERKRLTFDLSREDEIQRFYEGYLDQDIEYFAMSQKYAQALYTLIDRLKRNPDPRLTLVHTQMPGPLTWGLSLTEEGSNAPAWYNPTMRDILTKTLVMKAKWQENKLREMGLDIHTMVTLGEPSLGVLSSPFGSVTEEDIIRAFDDVFDNIMGLGCVHCCANMDWPLLMRTHAKVISFDAYHFSEKIALYPEEVLDFIKRGGMLAWGIVPVSEEAVVSEDETSLLERLERGMDLLVEGGVDRKLLVEGAFITPACVTSTLSISLAERAFRLTKNISQAMRERYSLN